MEADTNITRVGPTPTEAAPPVVQEDMQKARKRHGDSDLATPVLSPNRYACEKRSQDSRNLHHLEHSGDQHS